jgi:hypothetical protein
MGKTIQSQGSSSDRVGLPIVTAARRGHSTLNSYDRESPRYATRQSSFKNCNAIHAKPFQRGAAAQNCYLDLDDW